MPPTLVLVLAALLAAAGLWGAEQLLRRLALDPPERLTTGLTLVPALLGLAAFAGLLVGRPGPLLPAVLAGMLGLAGAASWATARVPRIAGVAPGASSATTAVPPAERRAARGQSGPVPRPTERGPAESGGAGPDERRAVAVGTMLFVAGALGTTLLTPLSGGALRIGDWVAHWFLVLVYLGQPLPDLRTFTNRVGEFGVISRPPLYNLEGGLLVEPLGVQFWPFQLLTPLLAAPVAATAVLWACRLGGARTGWVMAALVGLSPFLLQNAAYPWSKMVAAGLVLLFLLLIRAAATARRAARARQAFLLAACSAGLGYVAHQTTVLYVLPTLLWLVWRRPRPLFRRPLRWTLGTWALGGLAGLAAVAPWQGWVLATYGLRATLDANPASFGADVSETLGDWLLKGGVAALGTLVPLPLLRALAGGALPTLDQALRFQLAVLTGALGASGCWLLLRAAGRAGSWTARPRATRPPGTDRVSRSAGRAGLLCRVVRRPPWLALVVLTSFLGQVLLQPNWHETGDAAESMTPIVVLGLALAAREVGRLGAKGRRLVVGLVLAETATYLALWLWWAFSPAWTRDPNAVLAARYGLTHLRHLWSAAVPVGALLLAAGLAGSAVLLWRAVTAPKVDADAYASKVPDAAEPETRPRQPV